VSLMFGNSLRRVKLVVLSFSALLSYHIVNVVASLVNAAGTNLAMVDLVLGGGQSRVCSWVGLLHGGSLMPSPPWLGALRHRCSGLTPSKLGTTSARKGGVGACTARA
jgi:hypothetical protein